MTTTTHTAKTAKIAKTTPTTADTKTAQTPMSRDEVKQMLRDAAFVLQMTRRVKAEMMSDRSEAAKDADRKHADLSAELGV